MPQNLRKPSVLVVIKKSDNYDVNEYNYIINIIIDEIIRHIQHQIYSYIEEEITPSVTFPALLTEFNFSFTKFSTKFKKFLCVLPHNFAD